MTDETATIVEETVAPAIDETVASPATPETEVVTEAPAEEAAPDGPLSQEALDGEPEAEAEEKPKKTRFQERIDKLTADKYAAERESEKLRERISRLETRERPEVDPDDYEAVENDRLRRVFEETEKARYNEDAHDAATNAQQARQELFRAKLDAARDRIPDLQESVQAFAQLPVTPESAEIIADSDKAAELAHYLGKNPTVAFEISRMTPVNQGRAIAQIEHKVTLPAKRVSQAPPPIPQLKPASAPQSKSPSEMSAAEYVAMRTAEWEQK